MSDGSGDIIIKGGSCEIYLDESVFEKDENDPSRRVNKHDHKITNIVISGGDKYKGDFPDGFKGEIRITYNP